MLNLNIMHPANKDVYKRRIVYLNVFLSCLPPEQATSRSLSQVAVAQGVEPVLLLEGRWFDSPSLLNVYMIYFK